MGGASTRRVEWSASALSDTDWATSRIRWGASTSGRICVTTDTWATWGADAPSRGRALWRRNTVAAPWARHGANIASSVLRRIAVIKKIYIYILDRTNISSISISIFSLVSSRGVQKVVPRGARQGRHRDRLERVPVHAGRLRGWRVHKHGRLVPMRVPEWLHVGREWEAVRGQQRMPVPAEHMRERDVHEHRRGFRVLVQRGIHPGSEPGLRGRERVPRARQPMRLPLPQRPWLVQMHLPLRLHSGSGRETLHRSPISYPLIFFIISLENFQLYSITYMIHERCLSLFQTWTSARHLRTIASISARILSAPSCASAHLDTSRSVWQTSAKTSTNARLIQACAEMANAWTWRVVTSAFATTGSSRVRMENLA